jgi:L-fuconolactonase
MKIIRRNFLPADLEPVLKQNQVAGCIAVQADQSEKETAFLTEQAKANPFIKGVVGWVDLQSEDLDQKLDFYSKVPIIKGFRHVLQAEAPEFMLRDSFLRGIKKLYHYGFTYDILIFPHQLSSAFALVKQFPDQLFVIDHLAKPYISKGLISDWKRDMQLMAAFENVYCKISGMVTEADLGKSKQEDFIPYLEIVTEAFGTKRLMYGSDWPVCLVAAEYAEVMNIVKSYYNHFSITEKEAVFGKNAVQFYQL